MGYNQMIQKTRQKTIKYTSFLLSLAALSLLLTGCTPDEKTLLLTKSQPAEEESEVSDPTRDFTVKKIYAYTYTTRDLLMKSAFLQGCAENEINIAALDEKDIDEKLVYRQVDYRYGFYDTIGEFFHFWEDIFDPSIGDGRGEPSEDGIEGDLYIDTLLPSPDGTQLLVYIRSTFWDTCFVWLYTLGSQEPWLLYEGTSTDDYPLKGSFSPDGQWVTFDVEGSIIRDKRLIPVYDCHKDSFADDDQYWIISGKNMSSDRLYPPDELIYPSLEENDSLWSSELCGNCDTDSPALLSFFFDTDSNFNAELKYRFTPDNEPEPYTDSPGNMQQGSNSRLFLVGNDQDENSEDPYASPVEIFPALSYPDDRFYGRMISLLFTFREMPYFQYKYLENQKLLYYMSDTFTLSLFNMETMERGQELRVFSEPVWNFLPLESGDILTVITTSSSSSPVATENSGFYVQRGRQESGSASPVIIQNYWDIQYADLYLYPADGSERRLLYKNVQNLLNMEYDAQTRRILLETYETGDICHRRCIILEL